MVRLQCAFFARDGLRLGSSHATVSLASRSIRVYGASDRASGTGVAAGTSSDRGIRDRSPAAFRIVWGVFGTEYARLSNMVSATRGFWNYVRGLAMLRPPHYFGHNPAGVLIIFGFLTGFIVLVITGLTIQGRREAGPSGGSYDLRAWSRSQGRARDSGSARAVYDRNSHSGCDCRELAPGREPRALHDRWPDAAAIG